MWQRRYYPTIEKEEADKMIDNRPGARLLSMMREFESRLEELSYLAPGNTAQENSKALKELGDDVFPKLEKLMIEVRE